MHLKLIVIKREIQNQKNNRVYYQKEQTLQQKIIVLDM